MKPRPSRRHTEIGIIEGKIGTTKIIVEGLQLDDNDKHEDAHTIVSKEIFLSNTFPGSTILSAFELAGGSFP